MNKKTIFMSYEMTVKQAEELEEMLIEDILNRYNHPEYWNEDIIEEYANENNLEEGR